MWDISQESGDSISSCFFIGHRDAEETVFTKLSEAVEQHIVEYGVTDFLWDIMDSLTLWPPVL